MLTCKVIASERKGNTQRSVILKAGSREKGRMEMGHEKQFWHEPPDILGSSTSQVLLPWSPLGFPKCSAPPVSNSSSPPSCEDKAFGPALLERKGRPALEMQTAAVCMLGGVLQPALGCPGG